MPYISELLNNKITDSSDAVVGKLKDILISPKEGFFPPLEYLAVRTAAGQQKFVPFAEVANFNSSQISLKGLFNKAALAELPPGHYTYLKKGVLDQQIVDVAGTRVVRVNDLRIGVVDNKLSVLAIDASFRGLLRRLGLRQTFLGLPFFGVRLIDFRQARFLEGRADLQLTSSAEQLSRLHPADLANIVEELDVKSGSSLLESLDSAEAAKVLEEVDPGLQTVLVKYLGPAKAGRILAQMSSDEFVDLLKTLSGREARALLAQLGGKHQSAQKLLSYPDNTAGGLMTVDYVSVRPDWTVAQAVEEIRKYSDRMRSIVFIYITEADGSFLGVLSLRRLLLAKPDVRMQDLAKRFPNHAALKPHDKIETIVKLMTKYNLYTAAVLDRGKKLVGIVTIDDIMRQLFPTA